MVTPTWEVRERPLLERIFELLDDGTRRDISEADLADLVGELGLNKRQLYRSLETMGGAGLIDARVAGSWNQLIGFRVLAVTADGYRALGAWPSTDLLGDSFLAKLDMAIETASSEEERSRLASLRKAAGEVAKGTLTGVIVAAGRTALGLP